MDRTHLKLTIRSLQDGEAVLETENGLIMTWPAQCLPSGLARGQGFSIRISAHPMEDEQEREIIAKSLLNIALGHEKEEKDRKTPA